MLDVVLCIGFLARP